MLIFQGSPGIVGTLAINLGHEHFKPSYTLQKNPPHPREKCWDIVTIVLKSTKKRSQVLG